MSAALSGIAALLAVLGFAARYGGMRSVPWAIVCFAIAISVYSLLGDRFISVAVGTPLVYLGLWPPRLLRGRLRRR